MLPHKCTCNVYDDVIHCEAPPPNLNYANTFYAWFGAKPPNVKAANISGYTIYQFKAVSKSCTEVISC